MDTISTLTNSIRQGKIRPTQLMEQCLDSIKKWDPTIHAWVYLDSEQAMKDATKAEEELKAGYNRGPLHGIPIGIKDIIDVNDWPTCAGCNSWSRSFARKDASAVEKLRESGAILAGKTATTAYASFDPSPTVNPWNKDQTPGGSSSGSAASVAMRMVPATLGSQTGGSVTRPATYCGVAGIKPTFGWAHLDGILPLAPSMDHLGMFALHTEDLEILWRILRDTSNPLKENTLGKGPPRICVLEGFFNAEANDEVNHHMLEITSKLKSAGAIVKNTATPDGFGRIIQQHRVVMAKESAQVHSYWFGRRPMDYPPNITSLIKEGMEYSEKEYKIALEAKQYWRNKLLEILQGFDALLAPATSTPAPDKGTTGNPIFNSPWSFTGLPALSLATGVSKNLLPLGIQFLGGPWEEPRLFQIGKWCERELNLTPLTPPLLNH